MNHTILKTTLIAALAANTYAGNTAAPAKSVKKEESIYDKLWSYPVLYKNKDADLLNELRFTGRAQFDVFSLDSGLGAEQDWLVRRLRGGIKAKMFKKLTLHVEGDFSPQDPTPFYSRLTDAYLAWEFDKALVLKVGKQSASFTLDGATSSKELITMDRSNLANNLWFTTEYVSGVSISGTKNNWEYELGFFSGGTDTPEFGNFDEGHFLIASLGYDFADMIGAKKALLRGDYVYNDRNAESNATRSFEHIGSINFQLDQGTWGVSTDMSYGSGYGSQGDVFGFLVMPFYNITDKLQIVARYTYLEGDTDNSLRFSRYESFATSGRGDEYQEIYAGLNYYLYGHKLKLQTGFTYAMMEDAANDGGNYDGWSWTTGLRISW